MVDADAPRIPEDKEFSDNSEISSTDGTYATDCMYCTCVSVLVGLFVGVSVSHMT